MSNRNTVAVASGLRRISSRSIGPSANASINTFAKIVEARVSTAASMPSDNAGEQRTPIALRAVDLYGRLVRT